MILRSAWKSPFQTCERERWSCVRSSQALKTKCQQFCSPAAVASTSSCSKIKDRPYTPSISLALLPSSKTSRPIILLIRCDLVTTHWGVDGGARTNEGRGQWTWSSSQRKTSEFVTIKLRSIFVRSPFSWALNKAHSGISRTMEYISKFWSSAGVSVPDFASSDFNLLIFSSSGKLSLGRLPDENCLLIRGTWDCSLSRGSPRTSLKVTKNLSVFSASRVRTVKVPRGPCSLTSILKPWSYKPKTT